MSQTPSQNSGARPATDILGPSNDPATLAVERVAAVHRLRGMYA